MKTTQPDVVTCSCNNCDGHLEFERLRAGERVDCPHCGMETLLYIPQGAEPALQSPPPISTAQGEEGFLNEGGITVTKTRFMVHGQTYALANITSVSAAIIPGRFDGVLVFILFGGLMGLSGFGVLNDGSSDDRPVGIILLILGIVMIGVGIITLKSRKKSYAVILNTAGSEMKTYVSRDRDFILRIVAALNEAIVARG
jgi:hypothetical protein